MRRGDERGVMLMHAIVVMGLLTLAVGLVAGALGARAAAIRAETLAVQAHYAAESGVAATLAALRAGERADTVRRGAVGACTFEAHASRSDSGAVEVRSTGRCADRERVVTWRGGGP